MIKQGATPQVDQAIKLMREQLAAGEDQLGSEALTTYLSGDIDPEAAEHFFEAAAALYQRRPWERIPSDGHLFQVSCSALAIQGWVGCVIGQHREHYGVILFESLQDYEQYVELGQRFEAGDRHAMDAAPPHRAINFEAKADMPPPLLQEIKRYGWPLSPGDAYPTVMLIEPPLGLKPPHRADLHQLEAVALALVAWIEAEPQIARLWQQPSPKRRRFQVEVADARVPVTLGVVALDERPSQPPAAPAAPPIPTSPARIHGNRIRRILPQPPSFHRHGAHRLANAAAGHTPAGLCAAAGMGGRWPHGQYRRRGALEE